MDELWDIDGAGMEGNPNKNEGMFGKSDDIGRASFDEREKQRRFSFRNITFLW